MVGTCRDHNPQGFGPDFLPFSFLPISMSRSSPRKSLQMTPNDVVFQELERLWLARADEPRWQQIFLAMGYHAELPEPKTVKPEPSHLKVPAAKSVLETPKRNAKGKAKGSKAVKPSDDLLKTPEPAPKAGLLNPFEKEDTPDKPGVAAKKVSRQARAVQFGRPKTQSTMAVSCKTPTGAASEKDQNEKKPKEKIDSVPENAKTDEQDPLSLDGIEEKDWSIIQFPPKPCILSKIVYLCLSCFQ